MAGRDRNAPQSKKLEDDFQAKSLVDRSGGQLAEITEVWLICAPSDSVPKAMWDAVNHATSKASNLSTNFKFQLPELKAGGLLH